MSDSESNTPVEEEVPKKRGRGRPRSAKKPSDDEPKPKRPRGRPKGSFKKTKKEDPAKPKGKRGRPRRALFYQAITGSTSLSSTNLRRAREKFKQIQRHMYELESILFPYTSPKEADDVDEEEDTGSN